jgi:hypothetical protein
MTTTTAVSHQTRGVRGPLARVSAMRSSLRTSVLRPTYLGTTRTPTPAHGSRTTSSPATPGERRATFSSSRICRLPRRLHADMARAPAAGQHPRLD